MQDLHDIQTLETELLNFQRLLEKCLDDGQLNRRKTQLRNRRTRNGNRKTANRKKVFGN